MKNREDTRPRMEHSPAALNLRWLMKDERMLAMGTRVEEGSFSDRKQQVQMFKGPWKRNMLKELLLVQNDGTSSCEWDSETSLKRWRGLSIRCLG